MRLLWICLTAVGVIALIFYLGNDNISSSSLTNSDLARITTGGLFATILAAGLLSSGITLSHVFKNILIWVAIIGVLLIGYNNRFHLQDIAHNISGGLVPASVLSVDLTSRNTVTIDRGSNGHYQITGKVDDHRVKFLIDTGATSIVLTNETAIDIGIDIQGLNYTTPVSTANGSLNTARVRLDSISIGSITRKKLNALIAPSGALSDNLLGMNFINTLSSTSIRGNQLILID
ncbi:TIGR02281 family clan AA aspartic protease [Bartonella sp. HY406]|uniref:TIGR02281 family clan AA aspartic protease n=1 Tax=Bartonella sp. HY406 TaxID=2979331 RepID=UPI0021C6B7D0|nr:TIGR02281 family clan AA aspartic protease [Bartonella sp. HY406]UXN04689.1 TIGR02281 family clan AA aspartic protease [Bartonella sp. HY406]